MTAIACAGLLLVPASLVWSAQAQESGGEPVLGEATSDGSVLREWRGRSVLRLTGVCLAGRPCVGTNETAAGAFLLTGTASSGHISVTWAPVNDSLRALRVRVADASAEGVPPLELRIDALSPGEYPVLVEPARPVAGAWEQPVDWAARFLVAPAPEEIQHADVSTRYVTAPCALALCDATTKERAGAFLLPWRAEDAVLEAAWDPVWGAVTLTVAGASTTGETPLRLELPPLEAGRHPVHVMPELATPGQLDVTWTLRATHG